MCQSYVTKVTQTRASQQFSFPKTYSQFKFETGRLTFWTRAHGHPNRQSNLSGANCKDGTLKYQITVRTCYESVNQFCTVPIPNDTNSYRLFRLLSCPYQLVPSQPKLILYSVSYVIIFYYSLVIYFRYLKQYADTGFYFK